MFASRSTDRASWRASPRADLLAGARAMLPWLAGVAPFGVVVGMRAAQADMPLVAGWLTGPLVFAGSAQLAVIELVDAGALAVVVIAAVLAINSRLVFYSAIVARHWADRPRWWRAVAAYLLVDPSLAVGVNAYERLGDRDAAHRRYLGGAVALWVVWLAAITVGAMGAAAVPAGLRLELVVPLFLAGEVATRLGDGATRRAACVAGASGAIGLAIPFHLGLVTAIGLGTAAGLFGGRRRGLHRIEAVSGARP